MLSEPRSGLLAAWGNALLAGLVSPDDAALAIVGEDAVHRVEGLPGEAGPVGLTLALGRLRGLGATGFRVALPVPGHPLGLSGPPEFNARALESEEAVIASGVPYGLVPEVREVGPAGDLHVEVVWRCLPVREAPPADVPSLSEAERELAEALRDATAVLSRLDVAGSGPVAEAAVDAYRARAERGGGARSRVSATGGTRAGAGSAGTAADLRGLRERTRRGGERVGDRRAGGCAATGGASGPPGSGGRVQRLRGEPGAGVTGGVEHRAVRWPLLSSTAGTD